MLHWTSSLGSVLGTVSTVMMMIGGALGWRGVRRLMPGNDEGGKRAIAFVVHRTDDESAVWFVQRGERLLSTIVCAAEKDAARKLCAEPLAALRWLQ